MKEHFIELFEYNFWANEKVIDSIEKLPKHDEHINKIMAHIAATPLYWISRLTTYELKLKEIFPTATLEEIRKFNLETKEVWDSYLVELDDDKIRDKISYKNFKGETYTYALKDILMQLVLHSAYHRGQVAKMVRAAGGIPASSDYISFKKG